MILRTDMEKITPRFQPEISMLCGQTCIAMIGDLSLGDAINFVGKRTGTTGPDLHNALSKIGLSSSEQMVRLPASKKIPRNHFDFESLPKRCIAKVRAAGVKKSHWVLVWNGEIHDPYPGYVPWKYVSGYIEIKGENEMFKQYRRKGLSEMRPYVQGEDLTGISVSDTDHPEMDMGMIARNPKNHADQWYVARKYFEDNLEAVE